MKYHTNISILFNDRAFFGRFITVNGTIKTNESIEETVFTLIMTNEGMSAREIAKKSLFPESVRIISKRRPVRLP